MTILRISTARAFSVCLLAHVASTAAPEEARPKGSSCLLQRAAKVSNATLLRLEAERLESLGTTTVRAGSEAMSEALGWLGDIFAEEVTPLFNATTVRRVHTRTHWENSDKMIFFILASTLVLLDALVLQRMALSGLRQHMALAIFWMAVGIGYNIVVLMRQGTLTGVQWCSGYILEWLLSLDNLFIFHMIFQLYKTPKEVIHKALFLGIVGAVIFRFSMFAIVRSLLDVVTWLRFIFGAFLIWSGVQAAKEEEEEVQEASFVTALRWLLGDRLFNGYDKGGSLILWHEKKLTFTLMLPVILCLESTDLIFAVDSVSAKAAQIPDFWTSVTSSVFAMLAIRAMFFVVQDLVQLFGLLKYGLCFILVFIGLELMISDYVALPPHVVCLVILSVFAISIVGSSALPRPAEGLLECSPHSEK